MASRKCHFVGGLLLGFGIGLLVGAPLLLMRLDLASRFTGPEYPTGEVTIGPVTFVWLPPGTCNGGQTEEPGWQQGDACESLDCPAAFGISTTEVTWQQYWSVVESGREVADHQRDLPATISYHDAVEFAKRLSEQSGRVVRLPTETEWEYACRAGSDRLFPVWLGDLQQALQEWKAGNRFFLQQQAQRSFHFDASGAKPVASFPANDWGLYDMQGSVWEWCETEQPTAPDRRPIRGGAWSSPNCLDCRPARRSWQATDSELTSIGFRVVLEP